MANNCNVTELFKSNWRYHWSRDCQCRSVVGCYEVEKYYRSIGIIGARTGAGPYYGCR